MSSGVVHLVYVGDAAMDPCRRCGRTIPGMDRADMFTLDPAEATCEEVSS